jgi:hypothetical protein
MRPVRPSRHFGYALALAVILLSQQIVSQTQSPSQPSTNSTSTTNTKPNAMFQGGKAKEHVLEGVRSLHKPASYWKEQQEKARQQAKQQESS